MSARFGLILVQGLGALSLLPYPAILVANVMQVAAQGQTIRGAIPFVLLSLYPVVWIVLDVMAWMAFGRGATNLAFGLSSVPLVASLAGVLAFYSFLTTQSKAAEGRLTSLQESVQQANPLAWTMMCYFEGPYYQTKTPVNLEEVLQVIGQSNQINTAVPKHGTPLGMALWNFRVDWWWDGTPVNEKQRGTLRIIEALIRRGAHLDADESKSLLHTTRLRMALMRGPNSTERENPFVWEIVKGNVTGRNPFVLTEAERALLNRPTELYGSPLMASLLVPNNTYLSTHLILEGARLSTVEERDPAAMAELERSVFQRDESIRARYR